MPIFSDLSFFNEPEISDSGPPSLKSLAEDLCSGFLRPEKIHRPQEGLNLRTLDLEASTRPPRPTLEGLNGIGGKKKN